ncbi:MAG: OPT family oligopeptide transporter [Elusimicrobiota bacterium]
MADEEKLVTSYDDEENAWLANVYRGDKLPEVTLKVIVVGGLMSGLMIVFNVYMGLKTGWGEGGSIIAAILGFAIVRAFRMPYSPLENNMTQTMASAGGSIGNIVNVIPALFLLAASGVIAQEPTWLDIFLWVFFTSFLGVFFAIPLRKQIIVVEKLRFPSGTACAETITAMHASGEGAMKKAQMLGGVGLAGGLMTWFRDGLPAIVPSATFLPGAIKGCAMKSLTLGLSWSPMMFGAGFLVGPRVAVSLLIGGIITFGLLAPWLYNSGILQEVARMMGETEALTAPKYPYVVKWTMWPGLAIMVTYGLAATILRWKVIGRAFKSMLGAKYGGAIAHLEIPFKLWLGGLLASSLGIILMLRLRFDVPLWVGVMVIPLSFIFSTIAVRATGETDINPVGAMGAVTQIFYGTVYPGVEPTLLTGGVTAAGASEAADMMQDLKTGYLLGATPKKQTYIQLLGVLIGSIIAVPIFLVLIKAYGIGSEKLPAPAAITWSGLAQMVSGGVSTLPAYAFTALILGSIIGTGVALVEGLKPEWRSFMPSAVGLGVAMVVPAVYSVSIFLGAAVFILIRSKSPEWIDNYAAAVGAGGIAGEGLIGVLAALLVVAGIL